MTGPHRDIPLGELTRTVTISLRLTDKERERLSLESQTRGYSVAALMSRVIGLMVKDNMFNAVLDD